jgi:HK97 family phage portal protein
MNLARTFGTLLLHVYQRNAGSRVRVDDTVEAMLFQNPCTYMDPYTFRFVMSLNYELYGAAFAKVYRLKNGTPWTLAPIAATKLRTDVRDGRLIYIYDQTGEVIPREDMVVLMNTTMNGLVPLKVLDYIRTDIALANSAKQMQENFYSRGTNVGGIIYVPPGTDKAKKDEAKESFITGYSGAANAFKIAVIDERFKYTPISINSKSAEFLEAQKWTVTEVARRFGVPESFAGGNTQEKYSNAEQKDIDLVRFSILPRAVSWQDGFNRIFSDRSYFVRLNLNGLMRGDVAARGTWYTQMLNSGVFCVNDVRALEDMDPIPNGDVFFMPMNYVPRDIAIKTNPYTGVANETVKAVRKALDGLRFADVTDVRETPLVDKRMIERQFVEERKTAVASSRKALERLVRHQLKKEIDELVALASTASGASDVLEQFKITLDRIAHEFGDSYVSAFATIATKLQPIVQRQVSTGGELDAEALDKFLKAYGYKAADRHALYRAQAAEKALSDIPDDQLQGAVDDMTQAWITDVPAEESSAELHRSSNALTTWMYGALGVTYMHVVTSSGCCDFCEKLDGRVVEVNGAILKKGDDVDDGAGNVLHINKTLKHPPFHRGCECSVAPGK